MRPVVALLALLLPVACGDPTAVDPRAASLEFLTDSATIDAGDSVQLMVRITLAPGGPGSGGARPVTWTSLDTAIAVVDSTGLVRALIPGAVRIAATADSVSDTAKVTVVLTFASISAGQGYTCAVTTSGDVYCWGATNLFGNLGTGDTLPRAEPSRVTGGLKFAAVEVEGNHVCGLTVFGEAYCWGWGTAGQLGTGATVQRSLVPVAVTGGFVFTSIDLGFRHTCARTAIGAMYCWGLGGLGDSTGQGWSDPRLVAGGLVFASVDAGDDHSCGVTTASLTYCWGRNNHGQVGDSTITTPWNYPVPVHGGLNFTSVATSSHAFSCGIAPGNTVYCWGHNDTYQLGRSPAQSTDLPVLPIAGTTQFSQIALGSLVACGITPSGAAYCWGAVHNLGYSGPILGGYADVPIPVAVGLTFTSISLDSDHVCGMATDGRAYCWGANDGGQLGIGQAGPVQPTPVPVMFQR